MTDFLLWNTKEVILKNVGNKQALVPTDYHTMEVSGNEIVCLPNLYKYIYIYIVPKKKKIHSAFIHSVSK